MKSINILFIIFFSNIIFFSMAQNNVAGNIEIIQDTRIDTLIQKHVSINEYLIAKENHNGIKGYRIQIFFDSGNNSKNNATEIIEAFSKRYHNIETYISFREPYYRVRVGDFRTKLEAEGFLKKIIFRYPNAWIIKDDINFPKLY